MKIKRKLKVFSPDSRLMKVVRAVTAAAVLTVSVALPVSALSFSDCDSTGNAALISAADRLSDAGVFMGYPDGSFRPDENMSRAEMAAILGRMISAPSSVTDDTGFPDVDSSCFASGYIKALYEKKLVNGTDGGLFAPDGNVTYNEFIKSVVMLIEHYKGADIACEYPAGYINAARQYGIINEELALYNDNADTNSPIIRGAAAIILNNALDVPIARSLYSESGAPIVCEGIVGHTTLASLLGAASAAPSALPSVTAAPVSGVNAFAMNMNQKIDKSKNYMFSPLSIKMALAMAANGSADETKSEILSALGIDSLDEYNKTAKALIESYNTFDFDYKTYNDLTDKINHGEGSDEEFQKWRDMHTELNKSEKAYLSIANSVWINKDYKNEFGYKPSFKTEFENIIKDSYGGISEVVDNSNAVQQINEWTSEKTNGKIPSIIDDPEFLAALINAVYFNGKWANEFSEYATKQDTFHNADGTVTDTDFMNDTMDIEYFSDSDVQMIKLPYRGGNAAMYVSIDDGNVLNYDTYFDKLEKTRVAVSMPKFRIEYKEELSRVLKGLGISRAFNEMSAQFPDMCSGIPAGENVYIEKVLHKTYIDVDEKGTEAAAVTAVMAAGGTSYIPQPDPVEFKADKPFTFIIRDETSGEIIFMGRLADKN